MGAHSTIQISREKARMYLIRAAMTMSNSDLESALDTALDGRLYRVHIVGDAYGPDDDLLDYQG
jgi:hypothetical protein